MMMALRFTMLACVFILSACSNENQKFADACAAELLTKGDGKFTLKAEDFLAGVTKLPDGSFEVKGFGTYGAGTNEENKLAVKCMVALEGGVAIVQSSEFNIETK
jgi:hypothetical protein